jgi:hypothetical protein
MKKTVLFFLIVFALFPLSAFSFNWNFSFEEIPMFISGVDATTNMNYYSFFNIANLSFSIHPNNDMQLKFRIKDTYLDLTNSINTFSNRNKLYIDRFSFEYSGDSLGLLAGRDIFLENNGLIIGNLADGIKFQSSLFEFKQRFYFYHSGLFGTLPREINQFNANYFDQNQTNGGASRLSTGIALEKFGFLTKSISALLLYSMDLSTNASFYPLYLGLASDGVIFSGFSYNASFFYQGGSYVSNISLSAWAGDISLFYFLPIDAKIGFITGIAFATGDDINTTNSMERFNSFGKYDTDFVLIPDFSNLFLFRLGAVAKILDEKLSIKADYVYLSRMQTNDSVNGFYSGSGATVGHELSAKINWEFDPNISIFLQAGSLFGGDARIERTNDYKLIAGTVIKL